MTAAQSFLEQVRATRVVAVVRARHVPDVTALVEVLVAARLPMVEFTFTIDSVLDCLREARRVPGATVGAGTVLTAGQAREAIAAGAQYVVAPTTSLDVGRTCRESGCPWVPGALTPTEVQTAAAAGAAAVKIHPSPGPAYLGQLATVLDVAMMPSGGVTTSNARAYLDAGAVALFAGTSVAPTDALEAGDLTRIREQASAIARVVGSDGRTRRPDG